VLLHSLLLHIKNLVFGLALQAKQLWF
jgi:hypothetical protein